VQQRFFATKAASKNDEEIEIKIMVSLSCLAWRLPFSPLL
jgi:hypothetical protein